MIDEFIKPFKNPNNTRPWWVLLIILLCIYLFISYVDAWYFADRDGINGSELSGSPTSFLDSYHIRYYKGNYIGYATQYPTTDWTMYGTEWGGGTTWVSVRDTNNNEFKYLSVDGAAGLRLINIKRVYSGGTYYYKTYVNGVYNNSVNAVGTIPYYLKFFYYQGNIKAYIFSYGENEEKNIILTHPSSYFLAKDIFNSEFTGLYSSPNNQVWPNKFYAYYISDTPNKNITIKNKNTNQIIYSAQTSGVCGLYEFNFTQIFINNNVSTGIYSIQMDGSTQSQDITYKAIATSGTSIQWDKTQYAKGETATVTFSIAELNWITDDYSYELRILDSNLDEMWSTGIGARPINATQEISITTALFPVTGTYYATLYATDLSSGEEILLVYDDAYVYLVGSGVVNVEGITYFATNSTLAGGVNVSATQLGVPHYNTSDVSTGQYEIEDLITDWSIGMDASLSGFESYNVYFTPLAGGTFNVSIALVPIGGPQPGAWYDVTGGMMTVDSTSNVATDYWNATLNGTSVGGLIYEAPYWSVSSGALVTLSNSTWSDTDLTEAGGWYQFDNLTPSQYNISVSKTGFANTFGTVTPLENYFTRKDVYIDIEYTLTVNAKDLSSLGLITGDTVTISLSTGQSSTTTTGSVTFTGLSYNVYDIVAACDGYYAGYSTIILDDDMTVDVYLQSIGDLSGPASNYIPHPVRFTYVDAYGNPITGATVTANAQESTNPWGWLSSVFGFNTNLTDINTTLSGTTGHDGTLSFLMVETVQYRVHCVKPSAGIDHTVDIYPKESEYFIRIGSLPLVGSYPTYSLNATTIGGNVILFGNYTDTSGSSSGVRFIVRNSTSEVYNTSVTLTGGSGSASYAVNNTRGDQYTFGITAEHTTHGTIQKWIDITLKGTGRMIDFGSGWTDFMYLVMSIAAIFLVGGCFGEIDVRLGAIFIPITGGIFTFIGWMGEVYGPLITIAGVLGALYYMRSKAGELDK